MNLLKNIKIDKTKITQLGYVLATLFILTVILYKISLLVVKFLHPVIILRPK